MEWNARPSTDTAMPFFALNCCSRYSRFRSSGEKGTSRSFSLAEHLQNQIVDVDVTLPQPERFRNAQACVEHEQYRHMESRFAVGRGGTARTASPEAGWDTSWIAA